MDADEYPRFSNNYEMRAYNRRVAEMEEQDEAIDALSRLEGEFEDTIRGAQSLLEDGIGDMAQVLTKAREAKAIVMARRHIMETRR